MSSYDLVEQYLAICIRLMLQTSTTSKNYIQILTTLWTPLGWHKQKHIQELNPRSKF